MLSRADDDNSSVSHAAVIRRSRHALQMEHRGTAGNDERCDAAVILRSCHAQQMGDVARQAIMSALMHADMWESWRQMKPALLGGMCFSMGTALWRSGGEYPYHMPSISSSIA